MLSCKWDTSNRADASNRHCTTGRDIVIPTPRIVALALQLRRTPYYVFHRVGYGFPCPCSMTMWFGHV